MKFNRLISESLKVVIGLAPDADRLSGTQTGERVSLAKYSKLCALLVLGAGATGTTAVTVEASSDADGTGATAIAFKRRRIASGDTAGDVTATAATGFTTTAGGGDTYIIEVDAADTPDGKPWVGVKMVEATNDPVDGALIYILAPGRYIGDDLPTAIV